MWERLRRHLRYGTCCCVQAAREGMVPVLPAEDVERLDAAEAIERKRQGLAGCGVRLANGPNDVWISEALGYAICPALSSDARSHGGAMNG